MEPVALPTIYEAIQALRGATWMSLAPLENSLEGSITLRSTCSQTSRGGWIAGEALLSVRHSLIAAAPVELEQIDTVLTHPQVPGQCQRLLRGELAHAKVLAASSTAEAVRMVVAGGRANEAALGTLLAAKIHGGTVLREGVQDRDDNQTRFAWLAPSDSGAWPPLRAGGGGGGAVGEEPRRRGVEDLAGVLGGGRRQSGWLVRCLDEFAAAGSTSPGSSRGPSGALGHYMFFVDLQAALTESRVAEALAGVEAICEQVRVLGSYPASPGVAEGHDPRRHRCTPAVPMESSGPPSTY